MNQILSEKQYMDWALYYEAEPWGEERDDLRMARTCWAIAAAQGNKVDEKNFLFNFNPRPISDAEYKQKAIARYALMGMKPLPPK